MTTLYLILSIALAQNCPDQSENLGPYSFRRNHISKTLGCVVSVKGAGSTDTKPRRYFDFFKDGQIMVKTQIGSVFDTHSMGFRTYFILPANETQSIQAVGGKDIQVKDSSGLKWNFNNQGQIKSENGCKIKVNPELTWKNESTLNNKEGGFFISHCPGSIIVDVGFKQTRNPVLEKDRLVMIRDPQGKSCQVKNAELFNYPHSDEGVFKYKDSKDFYSFLNRKPECQKLDLSPFRPRTSSTNSSQHR